MNLRQREQRNLLLLFTAVVCVIALAVMIGALVFTGRSGQTQFTPPSFDSSAKEGTPDVPEDLGWGELDAKEFKVSVCGEIRLDGNKADIWLTNPEDNDVWLKLRALDEQGTVLGETGLIKPGEYIQSIHFEEVPGKGDKITLKLMAYEPDTYYSGGSVTLQTAVSTAD